MIRIYTDGSCDNSRQYCGANSFVAIRDGTIIAQSVECNFESTNNREEIRAVLRALEWLKREEKALILTDAEYVRSGYNKWMHRWHKRKFKQVKNADLWQKLYKIADLRPNATVHWIRGHNGNRWNELAHDLAYNGRKKCISSWKTEE